MVRWLAGALLALASLFGSTLVSTGRALAEPTLLPDPLPSGYTFEREGEVRWVYPTAGEAEVSQLKRALREAWPRVTAELGALDPGPLDIRVGVNHEQMQALVPGVRLPDYASGVALPAHGLVLLTFTAPSTFLRPNMDQVLVHELSHVAMHRALGGQAVPRWFKEGLAIHQADERSLERIRTLWEGTLRGDLIALSRLSDAFPARHGDVSLAYAQSADLVRHLLGRPGGHARLSRTLDAVRAGTPFDQALARAYGLSLSQLEQDWQAALRARYGRWPSLLMGLTAVWALGALLLVLGYVRARRRHHRTLRLWAIEEAAAAPAPTPTPPPPVPAQRSVAPPPLPPESRPESGIPTVIHDGQSHTLH